MMNPRPASSWNWRNWATLAAIVAMLTAAADAADQGVVWTDTVNVSVVGDVLQKVAGCDGCDDGGAASEQSVASGDGYVEFTVGETNTLWAAGLSFGDSDTTYADIDFAFRFNGGGWADVLENGVYQSGGDTPYNAGDVFRIAVVGSKVQYLRNGVLLHETLTQVRYPFVLDVSLASIGATVHNGRIGVPDPPPAYGGFLEKAGSPALRSRFTRTEISAFLPPNGATGAFRFPAPYNTTGVRLTSAADCGGQDCLWYVGYSYWRNTNNHIGRPEMLIFLGMDRNHGGAGPSLLSYDKATDRVQNLGPLFPATSSYSYSTGEGWYFSGTQATKLYVFLVGDSALLRYDVQNRQFEAYPALDLNGCPRPSVCPREATFIFQPHSSDDDLVHSATVQNAAFQRLGCVVYQQKKKAFKFYPPRAGFALDECHVDKSGQWLMLLEANQNGAIYNRIVELKTGKITTIDDVSGSLGHLDMGFGYAVGADNYNPLPNATILLKFPVASTKRPVGPVVHFNKRWDIAAANHVAHGNARSGASPESQYACGSNASRVADMADEIVCFSLDANLNADGSHDVLVVGQVLTDLDALGGRDIGGDDYSQLPKGNLDVTGQYFIWTSNMGGDRLDAFIVKVPSQWFATTADAAPPSPRGGHR